MSILNKKVIVKTTYIIACLALIMYGLYSSSFIFFQENGYDFKIFCSAVKVYESGMNPYNVEELSQVSESNLSFNNNPLNLLFFKILCKFNYFIIWTLILIISLFVLSKIGKCDWFFLLALSFTGFETVGYNYLTGNLGLIEMLLFSIAVYFLYNKKYLLSSVFLLLTGWLKILPLAYSSLLVLLGKKGIKYFLLIILIFSILISFSFIIFPDLSPSWAYQLAGKLPQHSPIKEYGGPSNPSSFLFFKEIINFIPLYAIFIVVCGGLFYTYLKRNKNFFDDFNYGILIITLILPRIKPYSFTIVLVSIYLLSKDLDVWSKLFVLGISSILLFPSFGYIKLISLFIITLFLNARLGKFKQIIKKHLKSNKFRIVNIN